MVAVAVVTYIALALWLTRGATFTADELGYFSNADGFRLGDLFAPANGHPVLVTRLLYVSTLELFGPAHVVVRVAMIATLVLAALLLFALLKRRVGARIAAAAVVVVLFLGSSPVTLLPPMANFAQSICAGLIAFVALERRDLRGDVLACGALIVAVFSHSVGPPLVAGAAVWVLLEPHRVRRAWVFVVPALAFGVWWLWAQGFGGPPLTASNVLLAPNFLADALAAAAGALTGLNVDFMGTVRPGAVDIGWGRVVAVIAVIAIVIRVRRVGVSPALLAFTTFVVVFCVEEPWGSTS